MAPPSGPSEQPSCARTSLAGFLRQERDTILAAWQQRVRALPAASTLDQGELLDHLPQLLDRIAAMVEDLEEGRPVRDAGSDPDAHAVERLAEGYDLDEVVQEFAALRQCVLELWARQSSRAPGTPLLNRAIDEAVGAAVSRYTRTRERTLVALDRIAAAALASTDLEALLQALSRVLLETTAAVDAVAIYLREGSRLHLRAANGMEEALSHQAAVEIGSETCAGRIAATGRSLELHEAGQSPLTSDELHRHRARAFFGVPMLREGEVVGVAHIASRTAHAFSGEDKLLFRTMVERATTAIVQHQLRAALDAEHRLRRAVMDVLPVGVWVASPEGRLTHANAAARALWGEVPGAEGIEGYRAFRAYWPATGEPLRPEEWGLARALTRNEASRDEELEIERFDGGRRTILNAAAPIRADDGALLGAVAVNVDITDRKEAERRERAARAESERLLAMLDALFAGAPVGLAFIDPALRYVHVNETLAALNGVPAGAHLGRTVREVIPTEADLLEGLLRDVLRTGASVTGVELRSAPPSSPERMRHFQLNAYPVRLPDGSVVGVGAAVVEVTELTHAIQARDDFLSIAAHDLRSPLTSLRLQAQSLLRKTRGCDEAHCREATAKLALMDRQIDRVNALLADLLDVSRIHAGSLSLELEEVDLAALVTDVVSRHEEQLASAHCPLALRLPQGAVPGHWDRLRLDQVVTNLVSNALKYGQGRPVEVEVTADETRARLVVRDHGVGIAPEHREAVFQRFERVGDRRAHQGVGLGLWIVKRIVDALGGTVRVESTPGGGATFVVELPRSGPQGARG